MLTTSGWTLAQWLGHNRQTPDTLTARLQALRLCLSDSDPAWTYILSSAELDEQLQALALKQPESLPLFGVPYVVKDNIDVAGLPTSAACPAFTYIAKHDAGTVAQLRAAGAIVIAKTNLDQFATGLVGTRSPYGAVPNSFNPDYISGGSSSGSSVAVAKGLVPFSLGTDTAGSGRVPAGFNNLVGLKPTKGRFSTTGVVPACRSLDCVSVFALTVDDAACVADLLEGFDADDSYSRKCDPLVRIRRFADQPVFGIPQNPNWFGDDAQAQAWQNALKKMQALGAQLVPLDFTPMEQLAALLYGGAWVAERGAAVGKFIDTNSGNINPVVAGIIKQATQFNAVDVFAAEYERARLARKIQTCMAGVDALLVPTTPRFPTHAQVAAEPVQVNSQLGTYTNFVNLADCAALSLPADFREDGLPFGITLIAPAWQDKALVEFGLRWQKQQAWPLGATGLPQPIAHKVAPVDTDYVRLAVVGAHLRGMPLNHQLTERGAIFIGEAHTKDCYRLYALAATTPAKPGLARAATGAEILLELWDIPRLRLGEFTAEIPAPLGIGTLELNTGATVKGFICEAYALAEAEDITAYGGWKNYLSRQEKAANS